MPAGYFATATSEIEKSYCKQGKDKPVLLIQAGQDMWRITVRAFASHEEAYEVMREEWSQLYDQDEVERDVDEHVPVFCNEDEASYYHPDFGLESWRIYQPVID